MFRTKKELFPDVAYGACCISKQGLKAALGKPKTQNKSIRNMAKALGVSKSSLMNCKKKKSLR